MGDSVSTLGASPDSTYGPAAPPRPAAAKAAAAELIPVSEDFGLLIEEDATLGAPVYKMVDRKTGKVVRQYERDALLSMREGELYAAGDVIKTLA